LTVEHEKSRDVLSVTVSFEKTVVMEIITGIMVVTEGSMKYLVIGAGAPVQGAEKFDFKA
jgi:hypothetical protein